MTHIADLAECTYVHVAEWKLTAVGWLDSLGLDGGCFAKGALPAPAEFLEKLAAYSRREQPLLPAYAGWHDCNLEACAASEGPIDWTRCGSGQLFVLHRTAPRTLYCAPRLICHCIEHHEYLPPQEFIDAVQEGFPDTLPSLCPDNMAYYERRKPRAARGVGPRGRTTHPSMPVGDRAR